MGLGTSGNIFARCIVYLKWLPVITDIGNQTVIAFRESGQMIVGHYTWAHLSL